MCLQFGTRELETFHAVKRVFDEHGLLNPARRAHAAALRTVRAMHVRRGKEKFPDLPRF